MPTEKAYLLIELLDRNEDIRLPFKREGEAGEEHPKRGIAVRIMRRFSGRRPI
jgi:hypothetical protein